MFPVDLKSVHINLLNPATLPICLEIGIENISQSLIVHHEEHEGHEEDRLNT